MKLNTPVIRTGHLTHVYSSYFRYSTLWREFLSKEVDAMNATLCRTTDADLEFDDLVPIDDGYETTPILAVTPFAQSPDEEELHMQFEEALCERATAFGSCLKCLRDSAWYTEVPAVPLLSSSLAVLTTEPLAEKTNAETSPGQSNQIYMPQTQALQQAASELLKHSAQRVLIYFCCALIFMLLGFDLMGLLVLHIR